VDVDDARTIGQRLRQIRYARSKSLRMVAGLAGISKWIPCWRSETTRASWPSQKV
jgi:hypothetical protein